MREIEGIVDRLNRAFVDDAWNGPAVLELLKGVTAEQATSRPIAGGHSIWKLALHIEAWVRAGGRRLQGYPAQLTEVEDWPAVTASDEQAWQQVWESIKQAHNELASAILLLDESRLDQKVIKGMGSVYVTLHGVIQHSLYHAGQILILKRASSEGRTA